MSEYKTIMEISHRAIKEDARDSLNENWGLAIVGGLVYMIVLGASNIIPMASLIVGGPLALGYAMFNLKIARNEGVDMNVIFNGFKNFGNALGTYLLMVLVIGIGFILLIIPGIVLALGLSQTMFILADEPDIDVIDALKKSWNLMDGYKFDYFILGLKFIPWVLVCLLTLGLGFFVLTPYVQVTFANYYDAISGHEQDEDDDVLIAKNLV